jgi:hypothetical protein
MEYGLFQRIHLLMAAVLFFPDNYRFCCREQVDVAIQLLLSLGKPDKLGTKDVDNVLKEQKCKRVPRNQ